MSNGDTPGEFTGELTKAASTLLAGAVSVTGVVAMGGAVAWARFDAAGLPAPQAVAVIGRNELITTGAYPLLGFVLAGVVAAACAFALDRECKTDEPKTLTGLIVIGALEVAVATILTLDGFEKWIAGGTTILAVAIFLLVKKVGSPNKEQNWLERWMRGHKLWPKADDRGLLIFVVLFLLLFPLAFIAAFFAIRENDNSWFPLVYLVLALGLGWLCYRIADETKEKFLWYGVAVFLSVVLFGAGVSVMRTYHEPKLQPLAAVLTLETVKDVEPGKDKKKLVTVQERMSGVYIGETDERLYFGLTEQLREQAGKVTEAATEVEGSSGSIFWVSCDLVISYAVGPPLERAKLSDGIKVQLADLDAQPFTKKEIEVPDLPAEEEPVVTEAAATADAAAAAQQAATPPEAPATPPGSCKS